MRPSMQQKFQAFIVDVRHACREQHKDADVRVGPPLDLTSLDSVRRFAAAWDAEQRPLHILVNNAGTNYIQEEYTPEGVAILAQVHSDSAPRHRAVCLVTVCLHLAAVTPRCQACAHLIVSVQ